MSKLKMSTVLLSALAVGLIVAGPASGQTPLPGPSTILNDQVGGVNCKSTSSVQCAENYGFAPSTGTNNITVTESPTTYTFADTFNQTNSTTTLSDFGSSAYTSGSKCPTNPNCTNSNPFLTWNFQDNYDFTTPGSSPQVQGAALSFSIPSFGVGLSNVEARIVNFATGQTALTLIGNGVGLVVDGWQTVKQSIGNQNLYTASLSTTTLAANTEYVLQIRGEALNSAASYTGSVTFTPVPLPPGLVLLVSGLAGAALLRYWPAAGRTGANA